MPVPAGSTSQPEYPLIDSDPHFSRVMRYMRPADLAIWTSATVAFPTLMAMWDRTDRHPTTALGRRQLYGITVLLGFGFGFLFSYQNSSKRFWGWTENAREMQKDKVELSSRAAAGKPIYGETELDDFTQGVAAGNSRFSQLKFAMLPWFNLVNHNRHGVDPARYSQAEPSRPS